LSRIDFSIATAGSAEESGLLHAKPGFESPPGFDHFLTRDYLLEIAAARSKWRRSALLMADV
jgi:hypothetical protein